MTTLQEIRSNAAPHRYPRHVLIGRADALILFAAGFHGAQDAIWYAAAGLTATCVDTDRERLDVMEHAYPEGWEYVCADVFDYALEAPRTWDVVSLDPPSNLFDRCAAMLPVWCLLARRTVVLGVGRKTVVEPPAGWRITETLPRSSFQGGVFWMVIER